MIVLMLNSGMEPKTLEQEIVFLYCFVLFAWDSV